MITNGETVYIMWDSHSSRLRAKANARKKIDKNTSARLHLTGVPATLKYAEIGMETKLIEGVLVLNDLTPSGMTLFLKDPLAVGNDVSITLENPRQFYVRGKVTSCFNFSPGNKIISKNPVAFRASLRFNFDSEEEQEEVRKYCDYISYEVLGFKRAG